MSEIVRLGDITGYDDAEVIEIEKDVYIVQDMSDYDLCISIDDIYDNTEN